MSKKILTLLASVTMLASSQQAFSSGFFLIEQSVSAMGTAYGSGASGGEDASTIWFNPAGMTRICGNQFVGGIHTVIPVADYDDKGSEAITAFTGPQAGPPTAYQELDAYKDKGNDPYRLDKKDQLWCPQGFDSNDNVRSYWVLQREKW